MNRQRRACGWALLAVAVTLVVGLIDWVTGYELNCFVLYFVPVSLAAWFLGLPGAVGLSVFSAMVWFGADVLTGHTYTAHFYAVWDTMIRLASFLAIGWAMATVRRLLRLEREKSEALRRSLSEIKVLETFLPVCAQCKKIRNEHGAWQPMEVYFEEHAHTQFSHGYCPECARKAMAEAGLTGEPSK
jgi:hypothetical protein